MKRLCFLCGKKIGFTRTFWDRHYCSAAHRRQARLASSQVVREEDDFESWAVIRSRKRIKPGAQGPTPGQAASAFAFFTVVGLLVVALLLPGPGGGSDGFVALDLKPGMIDRASNFVSDMVRQRAPVTLHYDFRAGRGDWQELAMKVASRPTGNAPLTNTSAAAPEIVRPGSFRLWNKSVHLQNYQMEFLGQIDEKSLSWAFRATDQNNFYASTIVMTKPGPQPNASLVHYVILNGREWDRVQLPIPMTLERGVNYRVRMSVQDDRFVAYLNGQIVSNWSDRRLRHGGVGFFADGEDSERVSWVSLSERDSLLGKMLSHFSVIVLPEGLVRR